MLDFIKEWDFFGVPVPKLNLRGESDIKTTAGALVSFIVTGLTTIFALMKL